MTLNIKQSLKHKVLIFDVDHIESKSNPGYSVSGRNWPGLVLMNKEQCGDWYVPILGQEVYESRQKYNPIVGFGMLFDKSVNINLEAAGQEITVQIAANMGLVNASAERERRAENLTENTISYSQFKGMSISSVSHIMSSYSNKAYLWAEKRGFIS